MHYCLTLITKELPSKEEIDLVLKRFNDEELYKDIEDENGTKIFEGDIVKARHNYLSYLIKWEDYYFAIEDKDGNKITPMQEAIDHFECEVIGNIYDNPELLEVSNG